MKKISKILAVLLMLCLVLTGIVLTVSADEPAAASAPAAPDFLPESVTATPDASLSGYAYVVYASEADFNADLDNGVIDGMVDGTSVLTATGAATTDGTEAVLTMPTTSAYVYLLQNVNTGATAFTTKGITLQINFGGKTLTFNNSNNIQGTSAVAGKYAFFNGTFVDGFNGAHGTFRTGYLINIALRDLNVSSTRTWGNSRTFALESNANVYAEDVTVDYTKSTKGLFTINTTGFANITLKNLDYAGKTASNGARVIFAINTFSSATLYADADCSFKGQLFTCTASPAAPLAATFENGVKFDNDAYNSLSSQHFASSFVEDGSTFIESSDADFSWIVEQPAATVSWYDENGTLLGTTSHGVGATPSFEYAPPADSASIEGDKVYLLGNGGWSTTDGGTATEITAITSGETERSYYCVLAKVEAAVAIFEDDTCTKLISASSEKKLSGEVISTLPEGAYVRAYTDLDAVGNFESYLGSITVDLGGNKLTHAGTYWATPAAGVTVTVKNGTIDIAGTYTKVINGAAAGTLKFHKIDIVSAGGPQIANLNAGSFIMELGSIDTTGARYYRPFFIGQGATEAVTASLEFYGVYHHGEWGGGSGDIFVTLQSKAGANNDIKVIVGDYEGTYSWIRTGYLLQFSTANLGAESKYEFVCDGVYLYGGNAHVTGKPTWGGLTSADLDKQNVSFYFDNFIGTRPDYFTHSDSALLTTATVNVKRFEMVYTDGTDEETGEPIWDEDSAGGAFMPPEDLGILANLTLYSDFRLNFYIPVDGDVVRLAYGDALLFDKANGIGTDGLTSDGKYYKVSLAGIAPNTAAASVELRVGLVESDVFATRDGATEELTYYYYLTAKYSVVNYVSDLLAGTTDEIQVNAMKAIIAYVVSAYDYFFEESSTEDAKYELLLSLYDSCGVEDFIADFYESAVAPDNDTDFAEGTGVTAAFQIGTVSKLYVTFPAGSEWTVKGANVDKSGTGGECVINLPAYALTDVLTITVGEATATFSFGEYVEFLMTDDNPDEYQDAVLVAMYAYGETAKALKATLPENA
ncbi:MAG: hypothetical protein IKA64_05515 [Clostridia bacterium]|nr:hypothetical protein [Clostridia bacterium]